MMRAHGTVYLSKAKPLATHAADGTFALTLSVIDSMGAYKKEPWTLHYAGPAAQAFWDANQTELTPGQPLYVWANHIRVYASARVPGIDASVEQISVTPREHPAIPVTQTNATTNTTTSETTAT